MLNQEIVIKRLALIKHLFKQGLEQSNQFETIASFSILSFHDSVEMFLKLASEHKNIKSDKFNFLDYWTSLPELTLKESMRNLNTRRVNIKHKGILPSKSDIEVSRVNTNDFFDQNTKILFGVEFSEISLLTLITYEEVKSHLEKSEVALNKNNTDTCIQEAAMAFSELLHAYEGSKSSHYRSPFYFGKDLTFLSSFHMGIGRGYDTSNSDRKMADFVDRVKESLEGIQGAIKIISFGIDYRKYVKFNLLTPSVTRKHDGTYHAYQGWQKKKLTKENCQYCIDFVIESTLKLQEFDFDVKELYEEN